jgi:hypothetical protein
MNSQKLITALLLMLPMPVRYRHLSRAFCRYSCLEVLLRLR